MTQAEIFQIKITAMQLALAPANTMSNGTLDNAKAIYNWLTEEALKKETPVAQ